MTSEKPMFVSRFKEVAPMPAPQIVLDHEVYDNEITMSSQTDGEPYSKPVGGDSGGDGYTTTATAESVSDDRSWLRFGEREARTILHGIEAAKPRAERYC